MGVSELRRYVADRFGLCSAVGLCVVVSRAVFNRYRHRIGLALGRGERVARDFLSVHAEREEVFCFVGQFEVYGQIARNLESSRLAVGGFNALRKGDCREFLVNRAEFDRTRKRVGVALDGLAVGGEVSEHFVFVLLLGVEGYRFALFIGLSVGGVGHRHAVLGRDFDVRIGHAVKRRYIYLGARGRLKYSVCEFAYALFPDLSLAVAYYRAGFIIVGSCEGDLRPFARDEVGVVTPPAARHQTAFLGVYIEVEFSVRVEVVYKRAVYRERVFFAARDYFQHVVLVDRAVRARVFFIRSLDGSGLPFLGFAVVF